jgi:hypothetical protein
LCIDYALRPRLSSRLTLGGFTFPRKPYAFGVQDFHLHYRYSCRHSHLCTLHQSSRYGFAAVHNALLPLFRIRSFGVLLIPDHLRRYSTRPVSYYALFKWWLLLSQHPGCLSRITSSRTKLDFGTLAGDLGCFHFDDEHYRSPTHSRDSRHGIRSLIGMSSRVGPHSHSVALPP